MFTWYFTTKAIALQSACKVLVKITHLLGLLKKIKASQVLIINNQISKELGLKMFRFIRNPIEKFDC